MIELVVVIAILGILMALLLPAVQSARESARHLECQHRIRQMALASHEYLDAHGAFPTSAGADLRELLPYLDQQALYDRIGPASRVAGPIEFNVLAFICPSDFDSLVADGNFNYLYNGGTRISYKAANGIKFGGSDDPRPRDVTDGLSNTALMAERLYSLDVRQDPGIGRNPHDPRSRRYTWYLPHRVASTPGEVPFIASCREEAVGPSGYGTTLVFATLSGSSIPYTHLLPPNSVGCFNLPLDGLNVYGDLHGVTSTSLHPGGVNIVYCDGHVAFINDSIDLEVWRAIGTRNGHEVAAF